MQTTSTISEVMASFGRRNKGQPLSPKKRKSVLANAKRAWLIHTLRGFARKGLTVDEAVTAATARPKLNSFSREEITEAYRAELLGQQNTD